MGALEAWLRIIVDTAEKFVTEWNPAIDCIVPAPPSRDRATQPVVQIARELGVRLGLPVCDDALVKAEATPQMKNIREWSERAKILGKAIQAGQNKVADKSILLIDDLIESGATLRRAAEVLLKDAGAKAVYALVMTRTK